MNETVTDSKYTSIFLMFTFLLAFNGGFGDASSFLLLGVFTGHLTGNAVLTMIYLVQGNFLMVVSTSIAFVGFIFGTFVGTFWRKSSIYQTRIYIPMVIQSVLIFAAAILIVFFKIAGFVSYLLIIDLTIALGIQNGMYTKVLSVGIHSSYITGATTTLVDTFLFTDKNNQALILKRKMLLTSVIGFSIGALMGSLATYYVGHYTFFILTLLMAILTIFCSRYRALFSTDVQ